MPLFSDDDNQWASLRAGQQAKHGAAIAYIKRQVGTGTEYANEVARVVLSDAGAYFQLHELPEEFVGALGADISHRLLAEADAQDAMERLAALVKSVAGGAVPAKSLSLYVLYDGGSLRARQAMFVFDYERGDTQPFTHGVLLPRRVPRVFKLRLHLDAERDVAGFPPSGIVLFLSPSHTDGGQCLLAAITGTADLRDLGAQPAPAKFPRLN